MTGPKGDEDHTARIIAGVPEGLDALVLAQLVNEAGSEKGPGTLLHVARDDRRLEALEQALSFFAPNVRVITFPAWDTVPYDRIGPHSDIVAKRNAGVKEAHERCRSCQQEQHPDDVVEKRWHVLFLGGGVRVSATGPHSAS